MKLKVSYADVAVGAKENFAPSAEGQASISTPTLLQGVQTPMYANPCEIYSVLLDGSLEVPPDDPKYALVSDSLSSATDGSFETPLVLALTATGQYTSQGITLVFDEPSNRYATALSIKWYRGDTLLSEKSYTPDSPNYFCANKVENYNKLIISFTAMNMPRNRLYLTDILYGTVRNFGRDEIENFSLLQEVEPVSETVSINTVNFTLKKQSDVDFIFQEKQPVYTYFDDTLVQTTFITHYERNSDKTYDIESEDYISILDDSPFDGGMYSEKNAADLIGEMLTPLKVEYEIADSLKTATLTGYLAISSCREALNQIAFALGAVVDTSYSDKVKLYKLSDTVAGTLNSTNTFSGQSTTFRDKLTELRLTAYSYVTGSTDYTAYKAADSGTGTNITVTFPEPLHSLSITNGTIVSQGVNQAVITANANCVLTGKKYDKTQTVVTKRNPLVLAGDKENVVELKDFTLVNRTNADALATAAYNYYSARREISEKILVGDLTVGDKVTQEYDYMDDVTGRIVSMKYNVSGTAKVAEVTIK